MIRHMSPGPLWRRRVCSAPAQPRRTLDRQCAWPKHSARPLRAPIEYNSLEFYAAPSIGIALFPDDGHDVTTVFKHADTAMYHAKGGSSGSIAVYTAAMSSRLRDWLDLEARLRRAVQDGVLRLHFQPKFRLSDNSIVGVEALLRWHDPEHGDISPTRFIEIAEDSGLIIDIGSLGNARRLPPPAQVDGCGSTPFQSPSTCPRRSCCTATRPVSIEAEAAAAGVPPSLIEIEITESLLAKDSSDRPERSAAPAQARLPHRVGRFRHRLLLARLHHPLPAGPDQDRQGFRARRRPLRRRCRHRHRHSLARRQPQSHRNRRGRRAQGQLEWLRARGCDEVQGFLLSHALPAAEFEQRFLFGSDADKHRQTSSG